MADLKHWTDLSEKEQADFAQRVKAHPPQGWDELARLAEESGIEPDADLLPTVYELEHWMQPASPERKARSGVMASFEVRQVRLADDSCKLEQVIHGDRLVSQSETFHLDDKSYDRLFHLVQTYLKGCGR